MGRFECEIFHNCGKSAEIGVGLEGRSGVDQDKSEETSRTEANALIDITTGIPYICLMEFEWDENKAAANLAKHGIPFEYAARAFSSTPTD